MPSPSGIAHAGLAFANPMSEAAVDEAIAALPVDREALVLETGCGTGEILLRTLRHHPWSRGLGVDLDADAVAEARRRAGDLPARFEVCDAATIGGSFDAVINVASSHVHGGFPAALHVCRAWRPSSCMARGSGGDARLRSSLRLWAAPQSMSFPISLVCGRRLGKPALTSSMSHLRPRPTGRTTRRRSPPTPNATARPTPSTTRARSASGAHCLAAPTPSGLRSLFYAPDRRRPTYGRCHLDLSGTLAAKFGQLSDDAIKRLRGVDLVGAVTP